ncbi:MAG: TIGR00303 family protein [Chloroflexi bacterium]|nr:TIGR00303 family protein [Chloroflexota bacterium]
MRCPEVQEKPEILFAAAAERGRMLAERWRGERPVFVCVLAHTDTCLVPGVSAAGISEELRQLTPAADAEVVLLGGPKCLPALPSNPLGVPGPSGITRAALGLARLRAKFAGAGLRVWPETPCLRLGDTAGGDIQLGRAVPDARALFDRGKALGRSLRGRAPYVVIAESVPGGTTTALAILLALGFNAEGRVSGSQAGNGHAAKTAVVRRALASAQLLPGDGRRDPLGALEQIGDPMQPVAVGIALAAREAGLDVLLAGGSQMLAVAALLSAVGGAAALDGVAVGTTRWIVEDRWADITGLAAEVGPELPLLAANLDFSTSRHAGLREYERDLVKEGVGAGAACIAACLCGGATRQELHATIDATYDGLLAAPCVPSISYSLTART